MKIIKVYKSLENSDVDETWIKFNSEEVQHLEELIWLSRHSWYNDEMNEKINNLAKELSDKFNEAFENRKIRWSID